MNNIYGIGDIVDYGERKFIVAGGVRTDDSREESRDYEFSAPARPVCHYLTIGLVDIEKLKEYMQANALKNISLAMDHRCIEAAVVFSLSAKADGKELFEFSTHEPRPDDWRLRGLLLKNSASSTQSEPEAPGFRKIGHLADGQRREQTFDGARHRYDISVQELETLINPNAARVVTGRQQDEVKQADR